MKNSNLLNSMRYFSSLSAEERQEAMAMMNADPVTFDIFIFFANMTTVQQEQAAPASESAACAPVANDATNNAANDAANNAANDAANNAANDAANDAAEDAANRPQPVEPWLAAAPDAVPTNNAEAAVADNNAANDAAEDAANRPQPVEPWLAAAPAAVPTNNAEAAVADNNAANNSAYDAIVMAVREADAVRDGAVDGVAAGPYGYAAASHGSTSGGQVVAMQAGG